MKGGIPFRVVMLEFMNAGIGDAGIGIIDDRVPLVIQVIFRFPFKFKRSPFELAKTVIKQFIRHARVDNLAAARDHMLDIMVGNTRLNGNIRVRQQAVE